MSSILGIVSSSRRGAPVGAYESIATITGNNSSTTLTFSSIPSTYTHLQIRGVFWDASGNTNVVRFNGDTGTNYSRHDLVGDGASVSRSGSASSNQLRIGYVPALAPGCVTIIDIPDYASTTKYKTSRALSGYSYYPSDFVGSVFFNSGLWMSTSAITSISFTSSTAYTNTTTLSLYGIKGA